MYVDIDLHIDNAEPEEVVAVLAALLPCRVKYEQSEEIEMEEDPNG